ncbi:MAG: type III-B CRISPR-associated protein Cas10/Cmr2 [bacterium]|nr:type III-B CRISPR-associated protein Cas10/Cmr2 [bacterium]
MAEQYLVNITVGPVQEFIASARKLRDLWYGSYLLSELSKAVARTLHQNGCTLIFPALNQPEDLAADSAMNVANKILACTASRADPKELVERSRDAFVQQWKEFCNNAMTTAGQKMVDTVLFQKQVEDFGEFFAAWAPYSASDYTGSLDRCEQLLAGRKSLREFQAPSWSGDGKPKSSLDGIRESVVILAPAGNRAFQIKGGEKLDALGIVKRFGPWNHPDRPHFDNLAEVAAEPYLSGLAAASQSDPDILRILSELPPINAIYPSPVTRPPATPTLWDKWPQGLSTDLLHPAVLEAERKLSGQHHAQDHEVLVCWEQLSKTLNGLWKKTTMPQPYICLLVGDGDTMGKTLNQLSRVDLHQQFSQKLDEFARDVHQALSAHGGKIVYSGGDDVMAYAPLHTALACCEAVRDLFQEKMVEACNGTQVEPPTFSLGMAIVHMHMPMHRALDLARKAERQAKEMGRNRLTIIQSKRSGSDILIHGNWRSQHGRPSLPKRLLAFAEAYNRGVLSSRLAYQLREIGKECGEQLAWSRRGALLIPQNPATAEAVRLVCRKKITRADAELLLNGQESIRQLADELVIAHQLSRALAISRAEWNIEGGSEYE